MNFIELSAKYGLIERIVFSKDRAIAMVMNRLKSHLCTTPIDISSIPKEVKIEYIV